MFPIAALPALLAWSSQQPALESDPKLATPISMSVKNLPIQEALAEMDKGVDGFLSTSPGIANLKISVFVKSEPCWKLMEQIADVLMCEWKAEKGGYRLIQNPLTSSQMQAYLAAERNLLQANAKKDLDEALKLTARPLEEDKAKLEALNKSGRPFRDTIEERRPLLESTDPRNRLVGDLVRRFSATNWNAFWKGQVMTAEGADSLRIALAFDPVLSQLVYRTSMGPDGALMGLKYVVQPIPFLSPPQLLAKQPFAKTVLEWPTPAEKVQADPSLSKSLNLSSLAEPSRIKTLADFLEEIFKQTGRPVVAEGFRKRATFSQSGISDLRSFALSAGKYSHHPLRIDGRWLLARHGGFWRQRLYEPPEAPTRLLAAKAKDSTPNLNDYANFAAKLTPAQAILFQLEPPTVEFGITPLKLSMPGLRFYGSLSPEQKQTSLAGTPIPFSRLTATQRDLFCQALSSAVFTEGDRQSWNSGLLAGNVPPQLANEVTFAIAKEMVYPLGKPLPGGRNTGKPSTGPSPNVKIPGALFLFGLNSEKRVGYVIPISQ